MAMHAETQDKSFYRTMQAMGIITLAAFTLAALAIGLNFHQVQTVEKERKETWHAVICKIVAATKASKATPEQKGAAVQFYNDLLVQQIHTTPCP